MRAISGNARTVRALAPARATSYVNIGTRAAAALIRRVICTRNSAVNRYFFHYRNGEEVARDSLGMFLSGIDEAHAEAVRTCEDLSLLAKLDRGGHSGEIEVADASGEAVLILPVRASCH